MNREIIIPGGAGIYPLAGDVQSQAGNATVTVAGLLNIPIAYTTFKGGEKLEYDINTNQWVPSLRACIKINNQAASDDYIIMINEDRPVKINGA